MIVNPADAQFKNDQMVGFGNLHLLGSRIWGLHFWGSFHKFPSEVIHFAKFLFRFYFQASTTFFMKI